MLRDQEELLRLDVFKGTVTIVLTGLLVWFGMGTPEQVRTVTKGAEGLHREADPNSTRPGVVPDARLTEFKLVSHRDSDRLSMGPVEFEGTGPAGGIVVLLGDGAEMARSTVGPDGQWTLAENLAPPLPSEYLFKLLDASGGVVERLPPIAWEVEGGRVLPAEVAFTLARPTDGGIVAIGAWTIAGTAKPGHKVRLTMDRFVLGTATAETDGTWRLSRTIQSAGERRVLKATLLVGDIEAETKAHTLRVVR